MRGNPEFPLDVLRRAARMLDKACAMLRDPVRDYTARCIDHVESAQRATREAIHQIEGPAKHPAAPVPLKCPHCGYDGIAKPEHDEYPFLVVEMIPRWRDARIEDGKLRVVNETDWRYGDEGENEILVRCNNCDGLFDVPSDLEVP